MKKIFSIFAAVLFAGSMMGQVITLTVSDYAQTSFSDQGITVAAAGASGENASAPAYNADGKDLRVYAGGTLTVSATEDITALSFAISTKGKNRLAPLTVNTGAVEVKGTPDFTVTWTGTAKQIVFTVGATADYGTDGSSKAGQFDFTAITVTMTPPAVLAPTFTPATATFEESVDVTLACATEGAEIFYTLDGTEPTAESTKFVTEAIKITETTTIKAIAIKGDDKSMVASKTYTKKDPNAALTCAEAAALAATAGNDTYKAKGYVTEIAYALQNGSMSFWMADTQIGGRVLEAYKCAIANEKDAPKVGDLVIVTGKLTVYNNTKEFAAGCTCEIVERAPTPENLGVKTIAEFLAMKNAKDTCILTGVVANIVNNQYGNFDLCDENDTVYVYGLLTADGKSQQFASLGVTAGDTLTCKAVYNEFNGNPQAKNAVFVSVKSAPKQTISIEITEGVMFTDAIDSYGWWQIQAENDDYYITLSNSNEITTVAGTYTVDNLDAEFSYIFVNETEEYIDLASGSITLTVDAQGVVTAEGTFVGSDGNTYNLKIVYTEPEAKTTKTIVCDGQFMYDETSGWVILGQTEEGSGAYLVLPNAENIVGEFDESDLDADYSMVLDGDDYAYIYTATIKIEAAGEGAYTLTADLLCYNNVLYKVTIAMTEYTDAIDTLRLGGKALKTIENGTVVIEKNNVRFSINGQIVR